MTSLPHLPDPRAQKCGCIGGRSLLLGALVVALMFHAAAGRAQDSAPQLLSTSLPDLQRQAAAGDGKACLQLGLASETGDGLKQDYVQARGWYEKAAAGGVAEAIYRLGHLYQDGLGVPADPFRAEQLFRLAALADVPLAQYNLGAMLVSARGVTRDWVDGLAWLILAARHQVNPEGEQKVRAYLADRPAFIAAAERRAAELGKQIEARRGQKPPWPPPAEDDDDGLPGVSPPRAEKPRIAAPTMEAPAIPPLAPPAIPPPAIPPPAVPPPEPANPTAK